MSKQIKHALNNVISTQKLIFRQNLKDIFFLAIGVTMASIGLKGFLLPNKFLDGGAMGVSLLLEIITRFDLSLLIVIVNLPFILIGAKQISIPFAVKSALAIFTLAVLVHFIQIPSVTNDKLLISVFGGFFLGAGIGFAMRGGAVIDGTEVLAITVSRKSSLSIGDFIALFNVFLFIAAMALINVETAMYSMLTYLSASKTVDFIINGIEGYIGVMIVSDKSDEIRHMITYNLGRGVTSFKADKGFGSRGEFEDGGKILFCVVTRLEVTKIILEIEKIDQRAFVVQHTISDTKGGMIKKRPMH
ncbi:MAG: YitT family protein [Bacteroidia bacterium]|nr:YitT family protein [Bacteroidia bacterium]HQU99627.1 YitT family protein [Bacteroidia bacterium]